MDVTAKREGTKRIDGTTSMCHPALIIEPILYNMTSGIAISNSHFNQALRPLCTVAGEIGFRLKHFHNLN
jgi:hypothetical protein